MTMQIYRNYKIIEDHGEVYYVTKEDKRIRCADVEDAIEEIDNNILQELKKASRKT